MNELNANRIEAGSANKTLIINGNDIATELRAEVHKDVEKLVKQGIKPQLAIILIGQNPSSKMYAKNKIRACTEVGIETQVLELSKTVDELELLHKIDGLNVDHDIHGILVQLPLPHHIDEKRVIERISPAKDVDGFHPNNVGRLNLGLDCLQPCAPAGIPELIKRSGIELSGKHAVIVGRSNFSGKAIMNILIQRGSSGDCTVTCCHSQTDHLANFTRQADILIAAIGVPKFITAGMVKDGAVVIDLGVNRVEDLEHSHGARLVGDVDFENVKDVASAITPVPGGVAPVTVSMLTRNTVKAAQGIGDNW